METKDEHSALDPASADPRARPGAAGITRGVRRYLHARGLTSVTEAGLANGRRADILALDRDGRLWIIEVKSSRADFLSDHKWPDYAPFCDAFSFAVDQAFPQSLLPADAGVLVADAYDAMEVRPAPSRPLAPARRKALLLRFARLAAERLHRLDDPDLPS